MKDVDQITNTRKVKVSYKNHWLIKLLYGDAAEDLTATFYIPSNIEFTNTPI